MPEHYGDLKSISIKGNMLCIIMQHNLNEQTLIIKTSEFCGVNYYQNSAVMSFTHYPSVHLVFNPGDKKNIDDFSKVLKELFGPAPKDAVGDFIDLLTA